LLVIADLRHASPRWPALSGGLIRRGWDVTVVTAPLGDDAARRLGFPDAFAKQARVVQTGPSSDVLQPLRELLWRFGLRRRVSLTEQLKERIALPAVRGGFDRAFQLVLALIGWPDLQASWRDSAVEAAEVLLQRERFDVMVSSSPYPTSHVVAATLRRRHPSLRWVADFRDLWADNHNYPMPRWRQVIDRRWERHVLRQVDALMTPTQGWSAHLSRVHNRPAVCVPNGYVDYEKAVEPAALAADRFVLLYSGVRYPANQSIRPLLQAIRRLRDEGVIDADRFCFRWIGPFDSDTAHLVAELGIGDLVSQEPPVSRDQSLAAQQAAHALLFLQWQDRATDWSSSLKLHEYVGSGRPILAIGGVPESPVSRLLAATGRACLAFSDQDAARCLRAWISEIHTRGRISVPPDWRARAEALSGISRGLNALTEILSPGSTSPEAFTGRAR
jgi:glycosyltransferase involved in cell wall biosynthesis